MAHSFCFNNEFFTPGWSFTSSYCSADEKDDINLTKTFKSATWCNS